MGVKYGHFQDASSFSKHTILLRNNLSRWPKTVVATCVAQFLFNYNSVAPGMSSEDLHRAERRVNERRDDDGRGK